MQTTTVSSVQKQRQQTTLNGLMNSEVEPCGSNKNKASIFFHFVYCQPCCYSRPSFVKLTCISKNSNYLDQDKVKKPIPNESPQVTNTETHVVYINIRL